MKKILTLLSVATALSLPNSLYAQDGWPDPTFDGDGLKAMGSFLNPTEHYSFGFATAVQPNGKILVAGMGMYEPTEQMFSVLVRLNDNGTYDNTFSSDGVDSVDFGFFYQHIVDIALQPDGKILVVATDFPDYSGSPAPTSPAFYVARFNANGGLDASFGTNGIATTSFGGAATNGYSIALAPTGKIVVVGRVYNDIAIAQYNADGTPDLSFDTDGKLTANMGSTSVLNSVAVQPDGKIVAVGTKFSAFAVSEILTVRYNTDGTPDLSFNGTGVAVQDIDPLTMDVATDVAIQPDGKIVLCGSTGTVAAEQLLMRYETTGTLDPGFDTDGISLTLFPGNHPTSLALQADGKIVTVGRYLSPTIYETFVSRAHANGSIDNTFDGDGYNTIGAGILTQEASFESVAIQPDGKIVAAGYADEQYIIVARFTSYNIALPISLTSFEVVKQNEAAYVSWDIAAGHDAKSFTIMHSTDGKTWTGKGSIPALADKTSYSFTDVKPVAGNNYYKLQITGKDGEQTFSPVRVVFFDQRASAAVSLYPNPVKESATLAYTLAADAMVSADVLDMKGKVIGTVLASCRVKAGNYQQSIKLPKGLAAGRYVLRVMINDAINSVPFVVE